MYEVVLRNQMTKTKGILRKIELKTFALQSIHHPSIERQRFEITGNAN